LLEVGVNGGHSAYLALTTNPKLEFHGVDICEHAYVKPAVRWLQAEFPNRVFFHAGDCLKVLPELAGSGLSFDCFHIDGAKHTYYEDILNCHQMIAGAGAVIVVDDTQQNRVAWTWRRCVRQGLIEVIADFPPMPLIEAFRHQIGMLRPIASWKRTILFVYARALTLHGRTRLVLGRARARVRATR
jgi:methyltransferase family protein